ncbi:7814_t:CDS:2 [Scutellospora calospora]|uniref:7814_t:CDS:1 n=1 Tax=Scutellospora calospora TaxID=85575 RepID=A0ACA9K394_9GLOM|nr:7814_t:CDS:2 [Scutellospora calospora]
MTNVYDQYPSLSSSRTNSANRPSVVPISALLNPEPDNAHVVSPASTSNTDNYENFEDTYSNSSTSQHWRRFSAPNLSSDVSNENGNNLTIIYHNNHSNAITPISSDSSLSTPTSPMSKHSSYLGGTPSRSMPSTRRSSMNRSSVSDQNSVNNMITPPQTPGVKSPTKANFQFPPNASDQNSQSMPPKVKRKRITQEQLADLVAMFEQTDTPSYDVREKLAKKLNMTNREVQVWFQNRRAKANRAKANEHNASHQHHRFLHHHSVSTAQAAGGHASSIGMINPGNFTFVPMFTNGGPSAGCPAKGRNNRRHSCVTSTINSQKKTTQNSPFIRQRAATVTGAPMTTHNSTSQKMGIPPSIKIFSQDHPHTTHHVYGAHTHGHTVPPSPVSPISPTTPILPPPIPSSHYMLPGLNPCTLPPPIVPPIKDLINLAPPSDLYQPAHHSLTSVHHQSYTQPHHSYSSTVETQSTLSPVVSKPSTSPIDILATAAEFVQSEEKEKERLRALEAMKQDDENNDDSQKSSVWRPWLV